jgi:hypothetical protein
MRPEPLEIAVLGFCCLMERTPNPRIPKGLARRPLLLEDE